MHNFVDDNNLSAWGETLSKLTACSCHVTYAFQSESTLYSCLNVKNTARSFGPLAKWLSVRLTTKWFWVRVQLQSLVELYIVHIKIFWVNQTWWATKTTYTLQVNNSGICKPQVLILLQKNCKRYNLFFMLKNVLKRLKNVWKVSWKPHRLYFCHWS